MPVMPKKRRLALCREETEEVRKDLDQKTERVGADARRAEKVNIRAKIRNKENVALETAVRPKKEDSARKPQKNNKLNVNRAGFKMFYFVRDEVEDPGL